MGWYLLLFVDHLIESHTCRWQCGTLNLGEPLRFNHIVTNNTYLTPHHSVPKGLVAQLVEHHSEEELSWKENKDSVDNDLDHEEADILPSQLDHE